MIGGIIVMIIFVAPLGFAAYKLFPKLKYHPALYIGAAAALMVFGDSGLLGRELGGFLLGVGGLMVYLAPAYIARNHPHFKQILLVNAFGGWTILLWAIALYWSLLSDADSLKIEQRIWGFFAGAEEPAPPNGSAGRKDGSASMADKLLELDKLRKNGLITEDDFNMTKRSLLDKNKEA